MRNLAYKTRQLDPRIHYRGKEPSRLENLTDGVFGIAITLLIFNLTDTNSFEDLLTFTKTLPAFLISITFLILIWNEHQKFCEIFSLNDAQMMILNTFFIALVIFYVYPLRFLTLFLTNFFFGTNVKVSIMGHQVPMLMMYYGFVAFALYFIIFLFYKRALSLESELELNEFEIFYTQSQKQRLIFMFSIPLLSIAVTFFLQPISLLWASVFGGIMYCLYTPAIIIWHRRYHKKAMEFPLPE